ncbi:hypothetical protein AGMMS50230_18810 [Spirochaetia bacterium]|nr:hypothetical protein AGMMS50230_18810 [Spirochaetia bacterium]
MKRTAVVLCFLCLSLPAWTGVPVPPPWIYGQWYTQVGMDAAAETESENLVLIFLPGDILVNGASVLQMINEGYITAFNQQISNNSYTIRMEYADGFWWEESFPMPAMTSVYIDKSYGEGEYDTMTYTFIPLGMVPPSPVPNDFE